ncbi:SPOR domain-containing protein [Luteimonas arsenica]|uniref:SPOR domain-containing protein n=1 Tax=Luteimonas arsenica TaxID=1586242 RepID=UPI00105593F2|nr:SPOR domain-containing protein [Luteimonas arsenica]
MESGLKQRLIGAAVLIALAVIFLPMLVQGPAPDSGVSDLSLQVPAAPSGEYVTRDLPLVVPGATSSAGLLADDGSLATVDTATAQPGGDVASEDAADLASSVETVPLSDSGVVAPEPVADPDAAQPATPAAAERPAAATLPPPAVAEAPEPEAPKPEPAKPAPAAAPAPRLPAATAGGDYAVNFGAYGSRADAGTVVSRLRESNLPAYVEETRVGDRDAWRVRIGPYATRADAESARVRAGSIGSRAQASVVTLDAATASPSASAPARSQPPAAAAGSAPTPAATPAAASGTGFAVQLGAFGNAAEANALRDRLRAAGIGAFTETVQTDKGALTRVKAGPVVTRAEADQLKARVKSSTGIDGLVRSHP